MPLRLAVVVSHPIQHFAPWHREVAKLKDIDLKVFFCCDWGTESYFDHEFHSEFKWDIPLLEGYTHEFLPIRRRPRTLNYWLVDNPEVGIALDHFDPHVVNVFGYGYRTNWRVARWTKRASKPLLIYSDSNARAIAALWKRLPKQVIVQHFYNKVDGALCVGDSNREYHRRYGLPDQRLFPGVLPIDINQLMREMTDRREKRKAMRLKLGIPVDCFVIMFCGKYSERKRPIDLMVAAHRAFQNGKNVWSLLVGEGSEREALEAFRSREKVANAVLTGFVNQSQIADYYLASDALAVTSSDDPHPLVVSEASAFGLPVIISDRVGCVGTDDTARPNVNAIVYTCGNREQLQVAIEQLCDDESLYGKMSQAACEIALGQDVTVAARHLDSAARRIHELGPR